MLKSLFKRKEARRHRIPDGERVYAIGDVHGKLDCLNRLLAMIDADNERRGPALTSLILLGDLIDRGEDSAGVIQRCLQLCRASPRVSLIKGNHEETLIGAAAGDRPALQLFDVVGGRETMLSYGVDPATYDLVGLAELATLINDAVPAEHRSFMENGRDQIRIGDYLFVHAGIQPGVALEDQIGADLRWIRADFLNSKRDHGVMVVHGHTITEEVDIRPNRIGIDTGAYMGGRLTAVGLEGEERWFLQTT